MTVRWDILGLGCATVDDLLFVARFPEPDTKTPLQRRERQGGGLTGTALVAASRLGARCAFGGRLGGDEISGWIENDLKAERIDLAPAVHRDDARPIHATILVDQEHHTRTILYSMDGVTGADDHLPPEDLIRSIRALFVDDFGVPGQIRAARIARDAGIPVVADFEREETPRLDELLDLVDHLIVSKRFAQAVTGMDDPAECALRLQGANRQAAIITCGADGSWYADAQGRPTHVPAFPVEAVDTTGCGDVYHGAYAWALTQGLALPERVAAASAAAALKATQPGGRRGIPNRERLDAFLRERGTSLTQAK